MCAFHCTVISNITIGWIEWTEFINFWDVLGWKLSPIVFCYWLTARNTPWLSFQPNIFEYVILPIGDWFFEAGMVTYTMISGLFSMTFSNGCAFHFLTVYRFFVCAYFCASTTACYLLWQSYYVKERVAPSRVKEDIVNYSKLKWPLLFSRFYEAFRSSGRQSSPKSLNSLFLIIHIV